MAIPLTVVIATCNRPDRLGPTLDAVRCAVGAGGGGHRLVICDNGSDRPARDVVERFASTAGFPVRYLRCPPLDRSQAMNAGVRAAETEWIAFTDDDTMPEPDWLRAASHYAATSGLRVFGGPVIPVKADRPLPSWLRPGRSGRAPGYVIFVRYVPRESTGVLSDRDPVPFGSNMFVRKDLFAQYGHFDELLWALCGKAALGGDDTEFLVRVRVRGEPIGYCREAVVMHPVHYERANLRSQIGLAYEYGWRSPLVFSEMNPTRRELYRFRHMAVGGVRSLIEWTRGNGPDAVGSLLNVVYHWGALICRFSPVYRRWLAAHRDSAAPDASHGGDAERA